MLHCEVEANSQIFWIITRYLLGDNFFFVSGAQTYGADQLGIYNLQQAFVHKYIPQKVQHLSLRDLFQIPALRHPSSVT